MSPESKTAIIVTERNDFEPLVRRLEAERLHPFTAVDRQSCLEKMGTDPAWIVFVDIRLPQSGALLDKLLDDFEDAQLVLVGPGDALERTIAEADLRVKESLAIPLRPSALTMLLRRARADSRHLNHQTTATPSAETAADMRAALDTERFLAVRQTIDKMSVFIARVANDVRGGVKYFNEMPYFVSIHSLDCRVLAANPTYLKYLGKRLYRPSCEIYDGEAATTEGCPVARTLRSGNVLSTMATVRYRSGARVPVRVHTSPIYDNDGNIQLVLEVFAGTKEIERLGAEIRTRQQRYHQLFDAVSSKIAVLDRRFRITAANRRFTDTFGDHIGKVFFDILRPGSFPAYRDPISKTMRNGMPNKGEMVLTDLHAMQYDMMTWTEPIKTASGKLIQVIVIFADVTELRQLEANLSSLGLMLSTISHDIRGVLTGLDAGLSLIDRGFYRNLPGQIEEGLDASKLMVERIRKLVLDILYTAKEREIDPRPTGVLEFAGDVAASVEYRIRGANVGFDCQFGKQMGVIEIDAQLLRSALINIFENALEACIADTKTAVNRIEFKVVAEEQSVCFQIADNGGGMAQDQSRRIFEKFYSQKGRKGTGLGLFITKKAIEKHGGQISVDSQLGEGTRFHIRLPRKYRGPLPNPA